MKLASPGKIESQEGSHPRDVFLKTWKNLTPFFLIAGFYIADPKRYRLLDLAARMYGLILPGLTIINLGYNFVRVYEARHCVVYILMHMTTFSNGIYLLLMYPIWFKINRQTKSLSTMLDNVYFCINEDDDLTKKFELFLKVVKCILFLSILGSIGLDVVILIEMQSEEISLVNLVFAYVEVFLYTFMVYSPFLLNCSFVIACYSLHLIFTKYNTQIGSYLGKGKGAAAHEIERFRCNFEKCLSYLLAIEDTFNIFLGVSLLSNISVLWVMIYASSGYPSMARYIALYSLHLVITSTCPVLATMHVSTVLL